MLFTIRTRRKEAAPWEVVDSESVDPVPTYYDDEDLDVSRVGDADVSATYMFELRQLPKQDHMRNAVFFAREQLMQRVLLQQYNVLLLESWTCTLYRRGKHHRVEVRYSGRPAPPRALLQAHLRRSGFAAIHDHPPYGVPQGGSGPATDVTVETIRPRANHRASTPTSHPSTPTPAHQTKMTPFESMPSTATVLKSSRAKLRGARKSLSKLADLPLPSPSRLRRRASSDSDTDSGSESEALRIEITSGPARTHSALLDTTAAVHGPQIGHEDVFVCKNAVDVHKLLHLSRRSLYAVARENGANVLLDEQWRCKITHPKFAKQNRFRVKVQYSAVMAKSCWPDAQKPVELHTAAEAASDSRINGLMTILERKE
ncbi:hypothetical protein HWV62_30360 [Athelia sp. TMB]|nr:hypothetical protein HWV62_30360 [Athelia sp. TMB]